MTTPKINRPLTDDERGLILRLAIESVAHQTGATAEQAAAALDDLAAEGQVEID